MQHDGRSGIPRVLPKAYAISRSNTRLRQSAVCAVLLSSNRPLSPPSVGSVKVTNNGTFMSNFKILSGLGKYDADDENVFTGYFNSAE